MNVLFKIISTCSHVRLLLTFLASNPFSMISLCYDLIDIFSPPSIIHRKLKSDKSSTHHQMKDLLGDLDFELRKALGNLFHFYAPPWSENPFQGFLSRVYVLILKRMEKNGTRHEFVIMKTKMNSLSKINI